MKNYANLHIALEQMRVRALRKIRGSPAPPQEATKKLDPPRVLVLGPEHSGKTSVCKILANYAVRMGQGWTPFLVNVNPSEVCSFCHRKDAAINLFETGCLGCAGNAVSITYPWPNTNCVSCKSVR